MSLEITYFIEREKRSEPFEKKGYLHIKELDTLLDITETQLFAAGLIESKFVISSTDLHRYQLTDFGREFFIEGSYQLLMLKPSKIRRLLLITSATKA